MPNPYTGTDNDPISAAQHQYLGKDWEKFFSMLGSRVRMSAVGPGSPGSTAGRGPSLGGMRASGLAPGENIGDADTIRTNQVNEYLGGLTDENKLRAQSLRDMEAHNQAVDVADRDRQSVDRAMAIANTPGVSQFGRPIAAVGPMGAGPSGRPVSESGSYTTLRPNPNEPQPPVNRQAIAAQMAPGQIAPPAPPPAVTFGPPVKATVDGKSVWTRAGSDGLVYDTARRPIDPALLTPPEEKKADYTLNGVRYSGATDKPIAGTPSNAGGAPLSATQRDELAVMDTVQSMSGKMLELGERTKWGGTGGMMQGTGSQFLAKNLGLGTPEGQELRSYIGQIKGSIAKLRGGTSFTPNEQELLDTYTPGIDDSPMVIRSKVKSLNEFVDAKRAATRGGSPETGKGPAPAGGDAKSRAADLIKKYGGG